MIRQGRKRGLLAATVGIATIGIISTLGIGAQAESQSIFTVQAESENGKFIGSSGYLGSDDGSEPEVPEAPDTGAVEKSWITDPYGRTIYIERSADVSQVSQGSKVTFTVKLRAPEGHWNMMTTDSNVQRGSIFDLKTQGDFTQFTPGASATEDGTLLLNGYLEDYSSGEFTYSMIFETSMVSSKEFTTTSCVYGIGTEPDFADRPEGYPSTPSTNKDGCAALTLPVKATS